MSARDSSLGDQTLTEIPWPSLYGSDSRRPGSSDLAITVELSGVEGESFYYYYYYYYYYLLSYCNQSHWDGIFLYYIKTLQGISGRDCFSAPNYCSEELSVQILAPNQSRFLSNSCLGGFGYELKAFFSSCCLVLHLSTCYSTLRLHGRCSGISCAHLLCVALSRKHLQLILMLMLPLLKTLWGLLALSIKTATITCPTRPFMWGRRSASCTGSTTQVVDSQPPF